MRLSFNTIPKNWKEGLLIGNGRLNAVVWGDESSDRISFNHEMLWTGKYGERKAEKRQEFLLPVRKFLKNKDFYRGTALASIAFGGDGGVSPYPRKEDMYKSAGDLVFYQQECGGEKVIRSLDTERGICNISHGNLKMETFADCRSTLIYTRWESRSRISGVLAYENTEEDGKVICQAKDNTISVYKKIDDKSSYKVLIRVLTDGTCDLVESGFSVRNASYIDCATNIGVSYHDIEKELGSYPIPDQINFYEIQKCHSQRFSEVMKKSFIEIRDEETERLERLFVNERIERVKAGGKDVNLMSVYAEFGKYLMVSGSICARMPLNLQGKWNCDIIPPWNCDYHFNINVQMNYWMAEIYDLGFCTKPLFSYIKRFAESGRDTAWNLYGCKGTVLSLNGDQWALSTPEACNYAAWIGGAAWICQHYWWHYQYSGDLDFLRTQAYPLFCETVDFYMDYIQIDEYGTAQISPSQSPENCFQGAGDYPVSFCISSAMDVQLAYDAFTYAIHASKILETDEERRKQWEERRSCLPEFKVGSDGRLMEWDSEEKKETEKGHRHYSHLYGLFPGELFTSEKRTEQFQAAGRSLDYRLAQDGGGTGWSRAWAACLYARLGKGEKALEQMEYLVKEYSSSTMLDLHPKPVRCKTRDCSENMVFQIDGNLGESRAVAECLVQYMDGKLKILPALPEEWRSGRVFGIKVPGGHTISFSFRDGTVTDFEIVMGFEDRLVIDNEKGCFGEEPEIVIRAETGTRVKI